VNVIAGEYGNRPAVLSKARQFAPAGVRILADTLEHFSFADVGSIALDWSNALGLQPKEAHKPVIVIETIKFVGDRRLTVQVRLDVDDLFGNDEIVADDFIRIIQQMEQKTAEQVKERMNVLQ